MSENEIVEFLKKKTEEKTVRLSKEAYDTLRLLSDESGVPMSKILNEWLIECRKVYDSLTDGKLLLMSQRYERDNVVVTYMAKIQSGRKYFVEGEVKQ
jgi:hypothetical protein